MGSKRIVIAPVGAGKTEAALQTLTRTLTAKPFARIWVLLATRRQEDAFRQRLTEYPDDRNIYFNVEFFNFYELNGKLLKLAGQPSRVLSHSTIYALLRTITQQLCDAGALELYAPIAHTPGFADIMADLINELKENLVTPETFQRVAMHNNTAKDRELAQIYAHYQQKLQEFDLVDREGEGWLALDKARQQSDLATDVDLLIVDGYDQFTEVQLEMLALLAERAQETLITLTTVPQREDTIGRRFQIALNQLRAKMPDIAIEALSGISQYGTHDIQYLIDHIFLPDAGTRPDQGDVKFIEAPDEAGEVAAVLRNVKRLLLENHCTPDDILIALRDWERYQPHFLTYQRDYQVPLALHYGERLDANPVIALILNIIDLAAYGFRRRDLLDVLRSPYVTAPGLDTEAVELLERISYAFNVVSGEDQWFDAIGHATKPLDDPYDEDAEPMLDEAQARTLARALDEFFAFLTPKEDAELHEHIGWIEDLIGYDPRDINEDDEDVVPPPAYTLDLIANLREVGGSVEARDLLAMDAFKKLLNNMLATMDLLTGLEAVEQGQRVRWEAFRLDLQLGLDAARINPQPNRNGQVLVTTTTNARGLPHQHVFVLGLSEGVFPAPVSENPLYLDSERLQLRQQGVSLKTMIERATDDGLFYEMICLPRQTLTFSRATTNNGEPWIESHLWSAAYKLFENPTVERYRAGDVTPVDEAASLNEVVLAVADGLNRRDENQQTRGAYNWLVAHRRENWMHIVRNRHIETARLSSDLPYDTYSGKLENPELLEIIASKLGESRRWSASQLNTYGVSPFQFFAQRLLKLEPIQEPEEGMDVLQRGTMIHHILELAYRKYLGADMVIHPDNRQHALEMLEDVTERTLTEAPEIFGFRPSALWQSEQNYIREQLRRFVEIDFSDASPVVKTFGNHAERRPYLLEAPFGRDERPDVWLEVPVESTDGQADMLRLRMNGYIDRIDRIGDQAVVIDYKSGSKQYTTAEMEKGLNYQMIVYLFAAQTIIAHDPDPDAPKSVAGGLFWSTVKGAETGTLTFAENQDTINAALHLLGETIPRMRQGYFPPKPTKFDSASGKCISYCDFYQMCRLCSARVYKPD